METDAHYACYFFSLTPTTFPFFFLFLLKRHELAWDFGCAFRAAWRAMSWHKL